MECKLKEILDSQGIKQRWFAKRIGVSETALSLIIRGKSIPTLKVALRIAKELDMYVEEIWILE